MDEVLSKLTSMSWPYADRDPTALAELERRLADVGRREDLINYTDLVRGVTFRLANVDDGCPFELGVPEWRDIDRAILGDFLGRLCVDSYRKGRFLVSALAKGRETNEPSEGFWHLVSAAGLMESKNANTRLMFWMEQVRKAHHWYTTSPA
jgi:hypothetical protein